MKCKGKTSRHHPPMSKVQTVVWIARSPLLLSLVIERMELAGCATAREAGVSEVDGSLAPVSQLLWTRKEIDCVQSNCGPSVGRFTADIPSVCLAFHR